MLTIALVAVNANVEGIELTAFGLVGRFHERIGFMQVLVKSFRLYPLLLSTSGAPTIVMPSVANLDLIHGSSCMGASLWIKARYQMHLVALTWNQMTSLQLLTYRSSDACEL